MTVKELNRFVRVACGDLENTVEQLPIIVAVFHSLYSVQMLVLAQFSHKSKLKPGDT